MTVAANPNLINNWIVAYYTNSVCLSVKKNTQRPSCRMERDTVSLRVPDTGNYSSVEKRTRETFKMWRFRKKANNYPIDRKCNAIMWF